MNDDLFSPHVRFLHGDPEGLLRSALRRSAANEARARARRRSRIRRAGVALATVLVAALVLLVLGGMPVNTQAMIPVAPADEVPALAVRHAAAVQAFRSQRYAQAFGGLSALADQGHAPSAAIALAMVTQGSWLLGSSWSATAGQLQRWNALAQRDLQQRAASLSDHDRGE